MILKYGNGTFRRGRKTEGKRLKHGKTEKLFFKIFSTENFFFCITKNGILVSFYGTFVACLRKTSVSAFQKFDFETFFSKIAK